MTRSLSSADERLLQRFFDRQLAPAESAAVARRIDAEPALRQRLQELQQLRDHFGAAWAGERPPVAGAEFTSRVLAAARRLPSGFRTEEDALPALRWCQRLLVVAAAAALLSLLWHAGWLRLGAGGARAIEAAPDAMRMEIERLDARIRAAQQSHQSPQGGQAPTGTARSR